MAVFKGTSGADKLYANYLWGWDVDPYIERALWPLALRFDDTIHAGGGDDFVVADYGDDKVYGGYGDDTLYGSYGDDLLSGSNGNDTLNGGEGDDDMYGGRGNDTFYVDSIHDEVYESDYGEFLNVDTVYSSVSMEIPDNVERVILTGNSDLNLVGSANFEVLEGNSGNNYIVGRGGNDTIRGRRGDDTLVGDDDSDSQERIFGGQGDDGIYGLDGNDQLRGQGGDDYIVGGYGMDSIYGGLGADTMFGGVTEYLLNQGKPGEVGFGWDPYSERDLFLFRSADEAPANFGVNWAWDRIERFDDTDVIDLRQDYDGTLEFIGRGAFTGGGQVRLQTVGTDEFVEVSVDADHYAEMKIQLTFDQLFSADLITEENFLL